MYLIAVWSTVFVLRMLQKEVSLRKKRGWPEYDEQSWPLIPKVYNFAVTWTIFVLLLGPLLLMWVLGVSFQEAVADISGGVKSLIDAGRLLYVKNDPTFQKVYGNH